jgi:hypothetical protein
MTRNLTINPYSVPGAEEATEVVVELELVDADGVAAQGWRQDGTGVAGLYTATLSGEAVVIPLTPTEDLTPAARYWVFKAQWYSGSRPRTYRSGLIQLASAGADLTLPEFLTLDESPGWWDVYENRLLPDPTEASNGSIPTVADGKWVVGDAPAGLGTVTSVAVSGSDGIEVDSGSPITSSGTIALGVNAATLRSTINVEDGATADQTAQEIATAIDADETAETTLKSALGLGTAAYTATTAYATSTQGSTADSALQPADIASGAITPKTGDLDLGALTGDELTADQLAAVQGAASPSAGNVFATIADLPADDQTAAEVSVSATPSNYSVATADVEAHLAGLDAALGSLGGGHDAVTLSTAANSNLLSLSGQEIGLDAQSANEVFAGPASGGDAAPAFRSLVADDIPDILATQIGDSTLVGQLLMTAPSAALARTALELGTASTTNADAYATSAQGALADSAVQGEMGVPNNALVRYDGTTGKTIQSCGIEVGDESDNIVTVTAASVTGDMIHFAANPGVNSTGFLFGKTTAEAHTSLGAYTVLIIGPTGGAYNHALGLQAGESGAEILHCYNVASDHVLRINTTDDEELAISGTDATSDAEQWHLELGTDPYMVFGGTAAQRVGSNELTIVGSGEFTVGLTVGGTDVMTEQAVLQLSNAGETISAGARLQYLRMGFDYELVSAGIQCDPSNTGTTTALFDINQVGTGSVLSSAISLDSGEAWQAGTLSGTITGSTGDVIDIDCDQANDAEQLSAVLIFKRT